MSDSKTFPSFSRLSSFSRVFAIRSCLSCAALLLLPSVPSFAAEKLTPLRLRIAGREVTGPLAPLTDGREIYIAPEVVAATGAQGQMNRMGDAFLLTLPGSQETRELAVARPNGRPMLALSDLARALNAVIERPEKTGANGKPIPGAAGEVVYLLARVTQAAFEGGTLQIQTSFPVPYRVRSLRAMTPIRSYVDCVGAFVPEGFRPQVASDGEKRALRLRSGQNEVEIARLVVEAADGTSFPDWDAKSNGALTIYASLRATPSRIASAGKPKKTTQKPVAVASVLPPTKLEKPGENPGESGDPAGDPDARNQLPRANVTESGTGNAPAGSAPGPAVGARLRAAATINGIALRSDSDARVRLEVAASGPVKPIVRYEGATGAIVVDIPNASLQLASEQDGDQSLSHPLLHGLHATTVQEAPPLTRITLEMTRVVGFNAAPRANGFTLELRLPKNATGALADKLIVVDPGHGGTSSGAVWRGGKIIYEKNICLAISLKLRSVLEAAGARVVITRDRDVNVGLYDRPRLANEIGADLFVSIHNDSNGRPNSASGTSAYYHKGDADSRALAICVQKAIVAVSGLPSRGALSDGILYASGLAVLRASRMPAILVEVAYINNARDRAKLLDTGFQQRVAEAIGRGLRTYVEGGAVTGPRIMPADASGAEIEMIPASMEETEDAPAEDE